MKMALPSQGRNSKPAKKIIYTCHQEQNLTVILKTKQKPQQITSDSSCIVRVKTKFNPSYLKLLKDN